MEFLKNVFDVVKFKEFDKAEYDEAIYHFVNKNYAGGEIERVYAPSNKIAKFMKELYENYPELLNLVKEVKVAYWRGNRFRGQGVDKGFIEADRRFLNAIIKEAYFEWIDMGWGHWKGDLQYDLTMYKY
jgi:hypothetical protein